MNWNSNELFTFALDLALETRMELPSNIDITEESIEGEYDSHESLGYMKRERSEAEIYYERSYESFPSKVHRIENDAIEVQHEGIKNIVDDHNAVNDVERSYNTSIERSEPSGFAGRGTNGIFVDENSHSSNETNVGDQSVYDGKIHAEATIEETDNREKSDTSRILDFATEQPTYLQSTDKVYYNYLPPMDATEEQFVQHTQHFKSRYQRYIQILIWCLRRRSSHATFSDRHLTELCGEVLLRVQRGLANEKIKLIFYTGTLGPLKPRVQNPQNEQVRTIIKECSEFTRKLHQQELAAKDKMPKITEPEIPNGQPSLRFVDDSKDLKTRYEQVLMRAQNRIREWAEAEKEINEKIQTAQGYEREDTIGIL